MWGALRSSLVLAILAVLAIGPRPASADSVYVEVLGKGGLWGVGYGHTLRDDVGLGVVGSFTVLDGQRIASVSPFLTFAPIGNQRHRWFVDVGPQLVHVSTPSPVPEWSGASETGLGAVVASGYELRTRVVVRLFAMAVGGKSGFAPWLGADVGWTL